MGRRDHGPCPLRRRAVVDEGRARLWRLPGETTLGSSTVEGSSCLGDLGPCSVAVGFVEVMDGPPSS